MTTVLLIASAVATLALDQASKALVTGRLSEGRRYVLAGRSGLRPVGNARAAPLHLSERAALLLWLAVVAFIGLVVTLGPPLSNAGAVGLGLVLGGAAGNLADRLARGRVVDFIVVGPSRTFNLADAAMVVGTVLTVWTVI